MPILLTKGISYSDFCQLTYGEMNTIAKKLMEEHEREEKSRMQNIACVSFFTAKFVRMEGQLPSTPAEIFPSLFGFTHDGKIPVENWQAGKERMKMLAAQMNARFERKGGNE